jgi:Zn-finger protein
MALDLTGKHYTFFQNKECEYFPCHSDVEDFNCLFCYCPLYRSKNCRGSFVMRDGIKDCSYCRLPHNGAEGYAYVLAKLREENN